MAKRRRGQDVSDRFHRIHPEYEQEILLVYAELTEEEPDVFLKSLGKIFHRLKIPKCFIRDILTAVEYYYQIKGTVVKFRNSKTDLLLQLIQTFTITSSIETDEDIVDIIDLDKLLVYTDKLLQFRDNYSLIKETWRLFVESSNKSAKDIVSYKLNLADLKKVKSALNLDGSGKQTLSDVLLIDMLSCCTTDESGNVNNFAFSKTTEGLFVEMKDFAYILGSLGEYE